jgi:hypothetical protein
VVPASVQLSLVKAGLSVALPARSFSEMFDNARHRSVGCGVFADGSSTSIPLTRPQPGPGEVLVSIVIGRDCSSHSLPS